MKQYILLLGLLFTVLQSLAQDKVMICKSSGAYAYHNSMCRSLRECRHAVEKVTLPEAVKLKRKPCGYCYEQSAAPSNEKPSTAQCKATTQKGTRCSRKGGSNGYCWQHAK